MQLGNFIQACVCLLTRNTFCGTWYLPHSHQVRNKKLQLVVSKTSTGRGNFGHSSINNKHYIA